jgi:hypothetical protein
MPLTKFLGATDTIQSLPNKPNQDGGFTPAQLKLKFDQHAIDNETYLNEVLTAELDALDTENVKKTGDQTIEGIKTFTSSPIVPAPTTDMQSATKKYVDNKDTVRKTYVDDNFTTKNEISTNRKLSATGDFTGTINGLQPIQVDPYVSAKVAEHTTQLDDYTTHKIDLVTDADGVHGLKIEEGTFTPFITGSGGAGTFSPVYSAQVGYYTIQNKIVTFKLIVRLTSYTGAISSSFRIGGLPFVAISDGLNVSLTIGSLEYFDMDTTAKFVTAVTAAGSATIALNQMTDNGAYIGTASISPIGQTFSITLSGQYKIA